MRDEGNAFVGQWEITAAGEARRVPSRMVSLGAPELLIGGLTALERDIVRGGGDRLADLGPCRGRPRGDRVRRRAAALRHGRVTGCRRDPPREAAPTLRSGALAAAQVLGINALRFGVPIGLVALMVLHPGVFTHYLWVLAESLGVPGILGPLVGWSIVLVPLAFLLTWLLFSVRLIRLAGWAFAGLGRGCQRLATGLAAASRR